MTGPQLFSEKRRRTGARSQVCPTPTLTASPPAAAPSRAQDSGTGPLRARERGGKASCLPEGGTRVSLPGIQTHPNLSHPHTKGRPRRARPVRSSGNSYFRSNVRRGTGQESRQSAWKPHGSLRVSSARQLLAAPYRLSAPAEWDLPFLTSVTQVPATCLR